MSAVEIMQVVERLANLIDQYTWEPDDVNTIQELIKKYLGYL